MSHAPLGEKQQTGFSMVATTRWQSRVHRWLDGMRMPLTFIEKCWHSRALRQRRVYGYIERKARRGDGSLRTFLRLPTFAGDYCFLIGTEQIRGLMQHPRLGQGELIGEGRQLYLIADALGRFRISKERQDAKQKRNILAHLVSAPERYVQTMREISRQLVTSWRQQSDAAFSVHASLQDFTVAIYLKSVMNFQGDLSGVSAILEQQIALLGQGLVFRRAADFNEQFQTLKRQLVEKIGNDPGLLATTEYTDRLTQYIDQHYASIQDEAFATGLNGAVLAGYMAPFPAFVSLVYELGQNRQYQQELRAERRLMQGTFHEYIRRDDTLLHACVHEVLRLHPSQPFIFRSTTCDAMIEGQFVKKNSQLLADVYHVLRSAELWGEAPQAFRPQRFMEQPERYRQPFLTYSSGPNNCTGQMFSRLSLKVLLAELVDGCAWQVSNGKIEHEFYFALALNHEVIIQTSECAHA